jgi:hypothetical protein
VAKKRVAVAAFAKAISNPSKRRRFAANQLSLEELLKSEDGSLTANDMPANLRSFFDGLSEDELKVLANLQGELQAGQLTEPVGKAAFTLGKF